jgi:aspartyl-tRNA(Asn)/glutamyl-tRNA(Gln) amidotransferase subunit A
VTALLELTAAEAVERVRAGELSAAELFEIYRKRAVREDLGAFLWVAEEAPEVPPGTPLAGVPLAVKDLFCVEDVPSAAGSRILEGYRPPYTATAVQKLLEAGAPLLGKTNQDEFAMGSSNENSGFWPVLNPWDRGRAEGPRPRWRRGSLPGRSEPTRGARYASPPRCAESSG